MSLHGQHRFIQSHRLIMLNALSSIEQPFQSHCADTTWAANRKSGPPHGASLGTPNQHTSSHKAIQAGMLIWGPAGVGNEQISRLRVPHRRKRAWAAADTPAHRVPPAIVASSALADRGAARREHCRLVRGGFARGRGVGAGHWREHCRCALLSLRSVFRSGTRDSCVFCGVGWLFCSSAADSPPHARLGGVWTEPASRLQSGSRRAMQLPVRSCSCMCTGVWGTSTGRARRSRTLRG